MTECHTADEKIVKCAYCGKDGPWRPHSGVYECGACWDWRKLDSPAARYWYILSRMVGSSVDTYDQMTFWPKKLELADEDISAFIRVISTMAAKTEAMAKAHHRDEAWQGQAQALFDQLQYGIRPKLDMDAIRAKLREVSVLVDTILPDSDPTDPESAEVQLRKNVTELTKLMKPEEPK